MLVEIFAIYYIAINLLSAFVSIYDKLAAKRGAYRIPEKTLFFISLLGGALFMYITMRLIRHKTLHKRFMIGLPVIIVLQFSLLFYIIYLTR